MTTVAFGCCWLCRGGFGEGGSLCPLATVPSVASSLVGGGSALQPRICPLPTLFASLIYLFNWGEEEFEVGVWRLDEKEGNFL